MYCNGVVKSMSDVRFVNLLDGSKANRQVVIECVGELYTDKSTGELLHKVDTLCVEVWGKQAESPRYAVGDVVDVIYDCSVSTRDSRSFNNLRARVILAPLKG